MVLTKEYALSPFKAFDVNSYERFNFKANRYLKYGEAVASKETEDHLRVDSWIKSLYSSVMAFNTKFGKLSSSMHLFKKVTRLQLLCEHSRRATYQSRRTCRKTA